jgi:hypothetical protein
MKHIQTHIQVLDYLQKTILHNTHHLEEQSAATYFDAEINTITSFHM